MSDDWGGRFPRSGPPREVKGGIRARSRRGAFARTWWARRWLAVLEALELGGRLARGRSYARRGQVMDIAVEKGRVRARVQGSREQPYEVEIQVATLSKAAWRKVARVLSQEAMFLAKLLAGEMPRDIERAFTQAGVSLFPTRIDELRTSCSCPDASNPCKHIAAVHYLLGEEFERDPFLVFTLRGMPRDELLRLLEDLEPDRAPAEAAPEQPAAPAAPPASAGFWRAGKLAADLVPEALAGEHVGAVLARLGPFPFWRGLEPLPGALLPVYDRAARAALALLAELTPARDEGNDA